MNSHDYFVCTNLSMNGWMRFAADIASKYMCRMRLSSMISQINNRFIIFFCTKYYIFRFAINISDMYTRSIFIFDRQILLQMYRHVVVVNECELRWFDCSHIEAMKFVLITVIHRVMTNTGGTLILTVHSIAIKPNVFNVNTRHAAYNNSHFLFSCQLIFVILCIDDIAFRVRIIE